MSSNFFHFIVTLYQMIAHIATTYHNLPDFSHRYTSYYTFLIFCQFYIAVSSHFGYVKLISRYLKKKPHGTILPEFLLLLSVPFMLKGPFKQTLMLSSCLLSSFSSVLKCCQSLVRSNILFLSLINYVFLLPRCPKDFFLFRFLNSRHSTGNILLVVDIEKYAFSIHFQFLKNRKVFLMICFSICSTPLLQFPFFKNSNYSHI